MREGTFKPPIVLRSGLAGESYRSLRGPFNLEGKPLLVDSSGPLDAPITGSERVKITSETTKAWMVAYLPALSISPEQAQEKLHQLLESAPVVKAHKIAAV
jgi:DNA/RNA-binding domain of Phe-tRNA-synthetase-like protein